MLDRPLFRISVICWLVMFLPCYSDFLFHPIGRMAEESNTYRMMLIVPIGFLGNLICIILALNSGQSRIALYNLLVCPIYFFSLFVVGNLKDSIHRRNLELCSQVEQQAKALAPLLYEFGNSFPEKFVIPNGAQMPKCEIVESNEFAAFCSSTPTCAALGIPVKNGRLQTPLGKDFRFGFDQRDDDDEARSVFSQHCGEYGLRGTVHTARFETVTVFVEGSGYCFETKAPE